LATTKIEITHQLHNDDSRVTITVFIVAIIRVSCCNITTATATAAATTTTTAATTTTTTNNNNKHFIQSKSIYENPLKNISTYLLPSIANYI
jgi:hypothetical protein